MHTHRTASAIVVSSDLSHVLLHRHRWSGRWIPLGGHIEPGEKDWETAIREASEESGIQGLTHPNGEPCQIGGSVHPSPIKPHEEPHLHDDTVWLLIAPPKAKPKPPTDESQECRFLSWDKAHELADDEPAREALRAASGRTGAL
jgi:8-oxo-dGTP pyrophosphatase MutT (NUDIX family)